ncbi:hypothetical protein Leryth_007669 [Lithospermum erythrorhizon]|nr:hypothetical protein Leryth_007669 [Lithospermum erythrorhizon]
MEPNTMKTLLLFLSSILLLLGFSAGPLITRLYFIYGGKTLWLSSTLQTSGFLLILIPLSISYIHRRKTQASRAKLFTLSPFMILSSSFVGLIIGTSDYFYAYGSARLPVSTASLIYASQLAFTAAFAYVLVKQNFSPYSVNTIVLLIVGPVVLALHGSSDRPEGGSEREYYMGFIMMALASILYAFVLPLMELSFKKEKMQALSYTIVMEYNLVACISATSFSLAGMIINNSFKEISKEAKQYVLGEATYYVVLISNAIVWQCSLLGVNGVIFCGSSLLSAILLALTIPITEVLSVMFFHENFQVDKGVALFLSLWGFVSYFYGEISNTPKSDHSSQVIETYQSIPETEILINQ